ncbi:MAG: hypothetical protein LBS50_01525 [Prevotellaceae bacterium]|jgi:hypothetical protein|nr:hypothetical protein [Prevotellaceae bacterium]
MKKILNCFLLLITATLLFSCKNDKLKTITIENRYSFSVPALSIPYQQANAEASAVYADILKNLFVMVIEETKDEINAVFSDNGEVYVATLDDYTELLASVYDVQESSGFLLSSDFEFLVDTAINSLPAYYLQNTRPIDGYEMFYNMAVIEGNDRFYQFIVWTLGENKAENENLIKNIIYSFSEKKTFK